MKRRARRALVGMGALVGAALVGHVALGLSTRIEPPAVELPAKVPASFAAMRAGVREVYLEGTPEQIGADEARLLRDRMIADEDHLWDSFGTFVPLAPVRGIILDVARWRYRHVDRGIPEPRRRELAAQSLAFAPDPFDGKFPTYQRMVFLHSLYDIALGFEEAPLVGCTAMAFGASATSSGHALVARAFDFEASEDHDKDKAVYFVRENGAIPFASVAWPGLVGVMTGMNLEGVEVFVNGARAKAPISDGMPVVFSLREVLERAHDTREAVEILKAQRVMVSHLVFVADAKGRFAVVERAPGVDAFVRDRWPDPDRVALTNHFEGPLASDPRNQRVRAQTTTVARRARADELVRGAVDVDARRAVGMMRDHACAGGEACALGDRRTLDAFIATHGVVADTTARVMWVSAGPHLSGKFVKFDLSEVFAKGYDPAHAGAPETIDEDPVLFDGRYEQGRARAGKPGERRGRQ